MAGLCPGFVPAISLRKARLCLYDRDRQDKLGDDERKGRRVTFWDDLQGWATAKSAALRLCLRMTVAGIVAYALAEMLALPQGYWAVFSSIIIMQASVGGSVKATIDRLFGNCGTSHLCPVSLDFSHLSVCPFSPSWESVGRVCSPFELPNRTLTERRITVQVVRIEDRAHVLQ